MTRVQALLTSLKAFAGREPRHEIAYQTLSVVEDADNEMHVEIADMMQAAEAWGHLLCDVARVMARDHADYLITDRADGDLFAAFVDGFTTAAHKGR
jgi:hypothetical protein